jgi:hypothetical protein
MCLWKQGSICKSCSCLLSFMVLPPNGIRIKWCDFEGRMSLRSRLPCITPRWTKFKTLRYLLSFHPSLVKIFSLATPSRTPSVHVLPLMLEIKFYMHTEPQSKL